MRLTAVSGFGGKQPACFLLEDRGARVLLDLGEGPDVGAVVDVSGVGPVDALVLSHGHGDHSGGLDRLPQVGDPPVYAAEPLLGQLPDGVTARPLPLGRGEVAGIPLVTGRTGHAPGGLWLRFDVAGGVLYMGDHCRESPLFAYDPPPPSRLVILDASYGADDTGQEDRLREFDRLVDGGPVLLPLPSFGRAGEVAVHLAARGVMPRLCDKTRGALGWMAGRAGPWLRSGARELLVRAVVEAPPIDGPEGVMLAADAQCASGPSAELAECWREADRPAIVFTGHIAKGAPAETLVGSGRAGYQRWNVHPRASENAALAGSVRAEFVMPAFCSLSDIEDLAPVLLPAVTLRQPAISLAD